MIDRPLALVRVLVLVVVSVVLQTVVLNRLRIFGVAPNLVLVMVILLARWVEPRAALLVGFTSGLVLDLLGSSPLGLRALVLTVVAFVASRFSSNAPLASVAGVWPISLLAEVLVFVLGTIAGDGSLLQAELLTRALVGPLLNLALAALLVPLLARLLSTERERGAVL